MVVNPTNESTSIPQRTINGVGPPWPQHKYTYSLLVQISYFIVMVMGPREVAGGIP